MKKVIAMLIGGIGSILLGLPYILHAFGPTEAEVMTWGQVSLYTGIVLVCLSAGIGRNNNIAARLVLALGYVVLILLQVHPIFLWFTFHGTGISDGTPPSTFVAHWCYATPHIALVIVSLLVLYYLAQREPQSAVAQQELEPPSLQE
ncbi:MAG: hypothetical protein JXB07_16590 [Anaerolineae bacterium]|nr:hypothetical protein [Anaerolineae bacterium]